ncbi:MAG: 50S ribosomal protein L33 [Acholeplasmatales bacterium]|jgi:large subunit ribosomal protein L33|nr:50S ribosomal protein L33 [Acholeplasmatales bacterium]
MREKIIVVCSECGSRNYTLTKNKLLNPERFSMMKFCKNCNKHTLHKESK